MGPLDTLNHLVNLAAPALALAILVPALSGIRHSAKGRRPSFWMQAAVNFVAGLAVLIAGLWLWGRDGKMAMYVVLVVVSATTQWIMTRSRHS